MVLGKLLLVVLLILLLVGAVAVAFVLLGSRRGEAEKQVFETFTKVVGAVFILVVLIAAGVGIHALGRISRSETAVVFSTPNYNSSNQEQSHYTPRPVSTVAPGTIITPSPRPDTSVTVNFGSEYDLTDISDYVYVMQDSQLYDGPGTDYDSVGSVSAGATLARKGYTEGWSLVDYGGTFCFIPSSVLIVNE